jgi:hypothetical protein
MKDWGVLQPELKTEKYRTGRRAPASGEYTITLEDGRVRPKHVDD